MSDIDDELLALAGGDVSSDEEAASAQGILRSVSLEPDNKQEVRDKASPERKIGTGARRRVDESDDGEDGSTPSSPASQQSVPMEESDSDSDELPSKDRGGSPASDDEDNKYPVEGLYASHTEKAEIEAMREIEREQILAERREDVERIRQNKILRNLVVNNTNAAEKKRKASAAELEDGQRKTSRVRTKLGGTKVGETSSGIDTLRRAREERNNRMQQREMDRDRDRRKNRSPSYRRSAVDDDGEVDSDLDLGASSKYKSRSPEAREAPLAELRDVERVRVGRSRFAEVCFFPGLEQALTGCFVRVNIGLDPATHQDCYRMALVKGFTRGRPYAMPNIRGTQIVVDGYVKVAHGKAQREWPFISCSDGAFLESEWERYKKVCLAESCPIPRKQTLVNKISDINNLVHHNWTEAELSDKLHRQNALRDKFSGAERDRVVKELERARAVGNDDRVAELQQQIDNMETPRLAFKTTLSPGKFTSGVGAKPSQQDRLAELNRVNRRRNAEMVRRAQILEKARQREIEAKLERGEDVEEDISRRLKTRMKFMHDSQGGDDVRARKHGESLGGKPSSITVADDVKTPLAAGPGTPADAHLVKIKALQRSNIDKGLPTIHKPVNDDDIIGALELEIDVDIDL